MLNNIAALLSGVGAAATSYESIATVTVGAGGSSGVTFSSIPSTYKHLQLRMIVREAGTGANGSYVGLRFNSDTGSNYSMHRLLGDGSTASAAAYTTQNTNYLERVASASQSANVFGAIVVDILDYTNTNKYKTIRNLGGWDSNGSGWVTFNSNLWQSTSAVTQIDLGIDTGNFQQYSHFALYGVKG